MALEAPFRKDLHFLRNLLMQMQYKAKILGYIVDFLCFLPEIFVIKNTIESES